MNCRHYFLIFFFYILAVYTLQANMASPYVYGYTPSVGLQSADIDIEKEYINITLFDSTLYAEYKVLYYINNEKEQGQLSLVFDAVQPYLEFNVNIDGDPVSLNQSDTDLENDSLDLLDNQVEFVLNVSRGQHIIEVSYKGYPSEFLGNWVTQYTYSYNLAPAKGWKSFNNLNLTIDATALKDIEKDRVSVTLQDSIYQLQGRSQTWQFDSIPQDKIDIRFFPKGDLSLMIYPEWILFIVFILLFVLNLWWSISWRRSHLQQKYPLPAILGALFVPAITFAAYLFSYPLIDWLIGKYAASHHGYYFLIILIYPLFAIIYFVVMWTIDLFYKRKLIKQQKV